MDAVEYFKAFARMCDSFDSKNNITGKPCVGCPLDDIGRGCHMNDPTNNAEECVAAVEKWAKEHPVKTRQSELLKLFPGAEIRDGVLNVCPRKIDPEAYTHQSGYNCIHIKDDVLCPDCMRGFWFQEIK